MNHLILGGAGFIGQNLARALFNQKLRQTGVTVIDNLSTSKLNREEFAEYKNLYRFIEGDLTQMSTEELLKIVRKHDKIWFLAGSVGVEHIDKHPHETLMNNVELAHNLIPFLRQAKRHVVFASTSEIYGEGPFSEESNASIGPSSKSRWGYASAKLTTEFMIRSSGIPYTIVRFFNVVGPGQVGDYGMVLPRFVEAAKSNSDIIVHGTGEQVRSFCHVKDAMKALLQVSTIDGELFNIGNDTPVTINQLAQRVIDVSGSSSKIVHVPYEQVFSKHHGDISNRVPNLTKLKSAIEYNPKYSLDDIIKDML